MEVCLKISETVTCLKWLGLSEIVNSIQLMLWILYLSHLINSRNNHQK